MSEPIYDARTLWELLERRVADSPDRAFLIDDADRTVTFSEAKDQAERMAAGFAALRSELKAKGKLQGTKGKLTMDEVIAVIEDLLPPAIGETRRYQTLQALVNCTRRSLMPDPKITDEERAAWAVEIRQLESKGIR